MPTALRLAAVTCATGAIVATTALGATALDAKPDRDFSGDAVASLNVKGDDFAFDVVPDGDGYYLIGGTRSSADGDCSFMVARYTSAGRLDSTFAAGGVKTMRIGERGCATSGTMDADRTLLVTGWVATRQGSAVAVVAIRPSGAIDRDFGSAGTTQIGVDGGANNPQVEVEPDGSVWLAWSAIKNWETYEGNYQVAHLHANGRRDADFGDSAVRTFNMKEVDYLYESAVDSSGRLIVTGWSSPHRNAPGKAALLSIDNNRPTYQRSINVYGSRGTLPVSLDADADGNPVVGITPTKTPGWGALRLTESLRFDDTYSGDGVAKHDCRCFTSTGALTPDGLVLVGGVGGNDNKTVLGSFTPNGRWDRQVARFGPWQAVKDGWEYWDQAAVDDAGRLVLAGNGKGQKRDALIGRLRLSGPLARKRGQRQRI